jgi:cell division protein FtsB
MAIGAPVSANRSEVQRIGARKKPIEPKFAVVHAKDQRNRLTRGKVRAIVALASLLIAGTLLLVAAGQAMVASQQVRLDALTAELQSVVAKNQNLQVSKARLITPNRILEIAEHNLGMTSPPNVTYLAPVNPGLSLGDEQARSS